MPIQRFHAGIDIEEGDVQHWATSGAGSSRRGPPSELLESDIVHFLRWSRLATPITVNAYGEAARPKRRRTVAAKRDELRVRKLKERTR
jgi:hypothetical protein